MLGGALAPRPAGALFLDEERTLSLTGKVFSQLSMRTEDSDSDGRDCLQDFGTWCTGFTFPRTGVGQVIQHRNLIDGELYHDLRRWRPEWFSFFDQLAWRFRVKYFYDGVYDYGPEHYRDPSLAAFPTDAAGLRKARNLDTQKDPIWNAYIDVAKGRVRVRVGRQDLSWGETDGFRLLDMIEPLDNRFGFPLVEDLDDRRIPLWMVRPTINLGSAGPVSNISLDSYWVPGTIDDQESPVAPTGNPFSIPAPPGQSRTVIPNKTLANSRGGGRLLGTIGDLVTASIGHYVTFNDLPSARLYVNDIAFEPFDRGLFVVPDGGFELAFYQQQITGVTGTMALPFDPVSIVRFEAANFWDERVFIPSLSVDKAVNEFQQTFQPSVGEFPTRNVVRWMLGFDRNTWIRALNPDSTFFFSFQYFQNNIIDYETGISNAVPSSVSLDEIGPGVYANSFHFVPRKNNEVNFTYLINTLYLHGTLQPQLFGSWDSRGVNSLVPSISYQVGSNWQVVAKYSWTTGGFANLGFFRDRDEFLLRVQYNLS